MLVQSNKILMTCGKEIQHSLELDGPIRRLILNDNTFYAAITDEVYICQHPAIVVSKVKIEEIRDVCFVHDSVLILHSD
jgi:hypothetical protein